MFCRGLIQVSKSDRPAYPAIVTSWWREIPAGPRSAVRRSAGRRTACAGMTRNRHSPKFGGHSARFSSHPSGSEVIPDRIRPT